MNNKVTLPVVFIRELVLFPGMAITLTVGRPLSVAAIRAAQGKYEGSIVTLTQRRAEDQVIKDLSAVYLLGAICKIEKVVALTDGGMQVQIEGLGRFQGETLAWQEGVPYIVGESVADTEPSNDSDSRQILESLSSYQPVNCEKIAWLDRDDVEQLKRINEITAQKQQILAESSARERSRRLKAME
jgi:ATP-dependent Lon protease